MDRCEGGAGRARTRLRFIRVGELHYQLHAAESLMERAALKVDQAAVALDEPTVTAAALAVAEAKIGATAIAILATNKLFELSGTQSTLEKYQLDRHWRNARVHTLHDPVRWKYHAIGNYLFERDCSAATCLAMSKEIRFNAFAMNCVGHMAPGLWRHPRDRSDRYIDLNYWTELARLLERGKFDGLFLADVLGPYDVYQGRADAAIHSGIQIPVNDPLLLVSGMAAVTEHLGFGVTCALRTNIPIRLREEPRHWII